MTRPNYTRLVRIMLVQTLLGSGLLLSCTGSGSRTGVEDDPAYAGIWAQEEAVERCMRERGFEYVAFFDSTDDLDVNETDSQAADHRPIENPNEAILARMNQEERAAYDEAYWGASAFDSAGGGCLAIGAEEAYGVNLVEIVPDRTAIDAWKLAVRQDDRVVSAENQWRSCMEGQGFVTSSDRGDYYRELHLTADEFSAAARELGVDRPELDGYLAFQAFYDGAFAADLTCRIDYQEVLYSVEDEYRPDFFDLGP